MDPDELAARLRAAEEDGTESRVEMLRDPRPTVDADQGEDGAGGPGDVDWAQAGLAESLSAAGAAQPAPDRKIGAVDGGSDSGQSFGVVFNPKDYPWEQESAVNWREHSRLEKLRQQWYGRSVGDGADKVSREQLDPWQRFA